MKKNKIDAYLIQETHLAGNFEKLLINDFYFIHHGPETQPTHGKNGGVAIILSPELHLQWKLSGRAKKIFRGGPSVGNTTRFLSISLRFETYENNNNFQYEMGYTRYNEVIEAARELIILSNTFDSLPSPKKLDYLITGDKPTKKKIETAKKLNIKILKQQELLKMLNKTS